MFFMSMCLCFFEFYWIKPSHSLKLRSTLNLSLRLQGSYHLNSWYHLFTIELYGSNLFHEFVHYITDLIEPLYIFPFFIEKQTYLWSKNRMINSKNKSHFLRFLENLNQFIIILVKYSIKLWKLDHSKFWLLGIW